MSTIRILNRKGDTAVAWSPEAVVAGDAEALAAVAEAERIFAEERAKGATAFRVLPNEPAERIDAFDVSALEIVLVPRIAGG